jgi:hypothetical protein
VVFFIAFLLFCDINNDKKPFKFKTMKTLIVTMILSFLILGVSSAQQVLRDPYTGECYTEYVSRTESKVVYSKDRLGNITDAHIVPKVIRVTVPCIEARSNNYIYSNLSPQQITRVAPLNNVRIIQQQPVHIVNHVIGQPVVQRVPRSNVNLNLNVGAGPLWGNGIGLGFGNFGWGWNTPLFVGGNLPLHIPAAAGVAMGGQGYTHLYNWESPRFFRGWGWNNRLRYDRNLFYDVNRGFPIRIRR